MIQNFSSTSGEPEFVAQQFFETPASVYIEIEWREGDIQGVLGNKCAGQHNLKTVHFKETLASDNFLAWSSAIGVSFCSALSTPGQRRQAFL
jgi:hypothetical protein